jgi:hypothetical protein
MVFAQEWIQVFLNLPANNKFDVAAKSNDENCLVTGKCCKICNK